MAKSSALPLLLVAGGAAVVMSKKKKRKKKKKKVFEEEIEDLDLTLEEGEDVEGPHGRPAPNWSEIYDPRVSVEGGGESGSMVFNAECTEFADKLNFDKHNQYITGMFHDMVEDGIQNVDEITLAMLKDQAANCPWDDESKWTDLMKGLYDQLGDAVAEYAAGFEPAPEGEPPAVMTPAVEP